MHVYCKRLLGLHIHLWFGIETMKITNIDLWCIKIYHLKFCKTYADYKCGHLKEYTQKSIT